MGDPEETTQQHGAPGAGVQPSRAVFLSYASQDAEAARKICEALRAAGIEVWFDQSELRGGDVWDQKIRRQIRDCALFIPVISANTASRHEGYFRLEWDLADERTHRMARDRAFIVPVSVDATPGAGTDMPESFHRVQWTRLPGGETSQAFVDRVRRLVSPEPSAQASEGAAAAANPISGTLHSRNERTWWPGRAVVLAIAAVAVVALGYATLQRLAHPQTELPATTVNSIAVLPLANESGDASQQYFSDGLSEDLITALSQLPGLKVIGRHSSFQFRDSKDDSKTIGAKLGVAHLLEGSVRRAGDMVRVSAELINTTDGTAQWSVRYDRPYKDLFALQDEITRAVAGALRAKLVSGEHAAAQSDRPPSGSLAAYNALLEGRFYYDFSETEVGNRKAIEFYTQATQLDPHYALAWSELSQGWTGLAREFLGVAPAQDAYAKARLAADRALALSPNLAAAHLARGYLLQANFDWRGADAEYRRALELSPNDGKTRFYSGRQLATFGNVESAIELTRQVLVTDPLQPNWYNWLAAYLMGLNHLDEAERAIQRAIELQPAGAAYHWTLTMIEIKRGNAQAALAAAQQEPPGGGGYQDGAIAFARQIGRDRSAADAALRTLIEKDGALAAYQIAEVYALRNDAKETFEWLDRAWSNRDTGIEILLYDPFIQRYKDDSRFAAFCRKVGLPVPGESTGT